MAAICNSWRRPNTLGPRDLQVGEDPSHGSHRAVAPMLSDDDPFSFTKGNL